MYLLNNIKFDINIQRTIGDTQYPAGWFLDEKEREKIGVVEVADVPRPDTALFNSTENPDGTWTATPKTADELEQERKNRVPSTLSPAQVRLVLNQFELLEQVESAIRAGSRALQIEWEFRTEFERDNVLLNTTAQSLGLTDAQVDEMFTIGNAL